MSNAFRFTMIPFGYEEEDAYIIEFDERNHAWKDGIDVNEAERIISKQYPDETIIKIESSEWIVQWEREEWWE